MSGRHAQTLIYNSSVEGGILQLKSGPREKWCRVSSFQHAIIVTAKWDVRDGGTFEIVGNMIWRHYFPAKSTWNAAFYTHQFDLGSPDIKTNFSTSRRGYLRCTLFVIFVDASADHGLVRLFHEAWHLQGPSLSIDELDTEATCGLSSIFLFCRVAHSVLLFHDLNTA